MTINKLEIIQDNADLETFLPKIRLKDEIIQIHVFHFFTSEAVPIVLI